MPAIVKSKALPRKAVIPREMTAARTEECLEKVRFSSERDALPQLLRMQTEARRQMPLLPLHLGENDRRTSTRSMRSSLPQAQGQFTATPAGCTGFGGLQCIP